MMKEISHRTEEEIALYNLSLLKRDATSLREETILLLRRALGSHIPTEASFERAARSLLEFSKKNGANLPDKGDTAVMICELLAERFPDVAEHQKNFFLPLLPFPASRPVTISCWMSNRLSEGAIDRFSSLFQAAKAVGVDSFSEVCERVAKQECDFGILPIENTTDGRLSSFYKMLDRHELKICAVCDVEDPESDSRTRLALVTSRIIVLQGDLPSFIEFSFVSANAERRQELLSMSRSFEVSVVRYACAPLSYRNDGEMDTVTFEVKTERFLPFLIYLHLFFADANVIGFFVQI